MPVVRIEQAVELLGPRLCEAFYQPGRVGCAPCGLAVNFAQKGGALRDEAAQDGVYQARCALLFEDAGRIHRRMNGYLGSVAGVFDLMSARDQESVQWRRDPFRATQKCVHCGGQP